jgi:hypothetical protein
MHSQNGLLTKNSILLMRKKIDCKRKSSIFKFLLKVNNLCNNRCVSTLSVYLSIGKLMAKRFFQSVCRIGAILDI